MWCIKSPGYFAGTCKVTIGLQWLFVLVLGNLNFAHLMTIQTGGDAQNQTMMESFVMRFVPAFKISVEILLVVVAGAVYFAFFWTICRRTVSKSMEVSVSKFVKVLASHLFVYCLSIVLVVYFECLHLHSHDHRHDVVCTEMHANMHMKALLSMMAQINNTIKVSTNVTIIRMFQMSRIVIDPIIQIATNTKLRWFLTRKNYNRAMYAQSQASVRTYCQSMSVEPPAEDTSVSRVTLVTHGSEERVETGKSEGNREHEVDDVELGETKGD